MKNRLLYRITLLIKTITSTSKRLFLFATLLSSTAIFLPCYAETTLSQDIKQEIAATLDNDIQDAVVAQLAHLEMEARQKNKTQETSETVEGKQERVKKDSEKSTEITIENVAKKTVTPVIKQEKLSTDKKVEIAMVENKSPLTTNYQSDDKNRNKKTTISKKPVKTKMTTVGWIYLGRFASGQWENPTLASKALPKIKKHYKVIATSVNVRDRLPKKDETGELILGVSIKQLVDKQEVALLQLKRSGRNGHYWAKIGVIGK